MGKIHDIINLQGSFFLPIQQQVTKGLPVQQQVAVCLQSHGGIFKVHQINSASAEPFLSQSALTLYIHRPTPLLGEEQTHALMTQANGTIKALVDPRLNGVCYNSFKADQILKPYQKRINTT